jgi:hypothetical protein
MYLLTDGQSIYGWDDGTQSRDRFLLLEAPEGYTDIEQLYIKDGVVLPIPPRPEGAICFNNMTGEWVLPPSVNVAPGVEIPISEIFTNPKMQLALAQGAKDSMVLTLLLSLLAAYTIKDEAMLGATYQKLMQWVESQGNENEQQ